jgi:hypothetical protein
LSYSIDHCITYLLITSLLGEVGLAEYICTHMFVVVFLAADPDYVSEEFEAFAPKSSRWSSYLSRVVL